ncbi:uncharacterized protein LOC126800327 [Argentina anserina]|uniref:uncharacterized protein LOC126800327 n=1 Tax=Argentina anserina TaxID=57926 RepID=UPI0021768DA5|nr:uncharacterized protein LOC126800327 [Potentilla anserina]
MDSISSCSPVIPKDLAKKKRTNRLAKLKQSKLDVRREQWLSHVKNKGHKVNADRNDGSPTSLVHVDNERKILLDNLDTSSTRGSIDNSSIHDSDVESLMSSPCGSSLDRTDSVKNLNESGTSGCSENVIEVTDDGCLDDWEAVADALTAEENQHNNLFGFPATTELTVEPTSPEICIENPGAELSTPENENKLSESWVNTCAWRPDDASRPQGLPNLSKEHSFMVQSDWHCGHGAITWTWQSIVPQPSSCPICYEDLDITDSCFLPCSCGFQLCLFCHKRILEADGRCPGCRKQYDHVNEVMSFNGGATTFRVA